MLFTAINQSFNFPNLSEHELPRSSQPGSWWWRGRFSRDERTGADDCQNREPFIWWRGKRAQVDPFQMQMQAAMESCPVKTVISGTMGFVLGGAFGLFMSSVGDLAKSSDLVPTSLTVKASSIDEL